MTVTQPGRDGVAVLSGGAGRNAGPILYGTEIDALTDALRAGHYGHGPLTEAFETALADFLGVPDIVTVASCTVAMQLALLTAGIGPDDEVIVPSMTFCSSVQAIVATGARPAFCEVDPRSLCVRPDDVLAAVTPTTRAVLPVLYFGRAVDLTAIRPYLDERGITVVEDAAQAFGSDLDGQLVGSTRHALTCFSFGPTKNLTCGEGGAVVPRTTAEAEMLRRLRSVGVAQTLDQRAAATSYQVTGFGVRAHLSSLFAAIGLAQLSQFDQARAVRQQLWRQYAAALANLPKVELTDVDIDHTVPYNLVVQIPDRDRIFHQMRRVGVGVGVHYPPNHLQPAFADFTTPLPITETISRRILSLPFHPYLNGDDITSIVNHLGEALN